MKEFDNVTTPFCVIAKTPWENGCRDLQSNSAWAENPYGDEYAVVPGDMVQDILATCGYCDIVLNEDGTAVVSFTAKDIPEPPEEAVEPSAEELLNAMLGVTSYE